MPEKIVSAGDVLQDIKRGMDSEALMTKHNISFKSLQNVYAHLMQAGLLELVNGSFETPPVRRLKAKKMAHDIRSGMSLEQMQERYLLSPAQLQKAIDVLLENKVISPGQLRKDSPQRHQELLSASLRGVERCYLDFELPIVDTGPPEIDGTVRDITEKGVGVVGIPAQPGDIRTLLVLHDELIMIEPFIFEARCQWVSKKKPGVDCVAGFQITHISEKDLKELRNLIDLVTFCE
jgi:hypothetical protein